MKIEHDASPPRVLLGEFHGSVALIYGNPKVAQLHVSDGSLTCDGQSENGQFSTDMAENKIKHTFALTCSNGLS